MRSNFAGHSRLALTAALTIAVLALSGCGGGQEETLTAQPTLSQRLVSSMCDSEPFFQLADSVAGAAQSASQQENEAVRDSMFMLVSAPDLNNSQLHDCQRLINDTTRPGDVADSLPLVGLFVSRARVASASFANGMVVADIINYGPGRYDPLGIDVGLSCLWIRSPASESGNWTAAIFEPGPGGCAGADFQLEQATPLEVHVRRVEEENRTPRAYPSTGRWMWDQRSGNQFIGIRCGDAWCEIGQNFASRGPIPDSAAVPGWFDEQILSYPDSDGVLVISNVLGRVRPGNQNTIAFQRSPATVASNHDTLHVATVSFDTLSFGGSSGGKAGWTAYIDKFGLGADAALGTDYDINLTAAVPPGGEAEWQAHGPQALLHVLARRQQHSGSGTVRWAWVTDDEGVWVPCDEGCCMATKHR